MTCRAIEEMIEKSYREGKMEIIYRMLKSEMFEVEEIAALTDFSLEDIKKAKADME